MCGLILLAKFLEMILCMSFMTLMIDIVFKDWVELLECRVKTEFNKSF
jgi:hypothetical protein